jgi:hypothetical protein
MVTQLNASVASTREMESESHRRRKPSRLLKNHDEAFFLMFAARGE